MLSNKTLTLGKNINIDKPIITDLCVSVLTSLCTTSSLIDLDILSKKLVIDDIHIIGLVYRPNNKAPPLIRGYQGNNDYIKSFPHQLTIYVCPDTTNETKLINVKIFKNGKLQSTGSRNEGESRKVFNLIFDQFKKINCFESKPVLDNFNIVLLNGICYVKNKLNQKYEINLNILSKMVSKKYDLKIDYKQSVHPPAKIWYLYNKNNIKKDGRCYCKVRCSYANNKNVDNCCKKIIIQVQHTGIIQFMGPKNNVQLLEVYDFIKNIFYEDYYYFCKNKNIDKKLIF